MNRLKLIQQAIEAAGAHRAAIVSQADIVYDPVFRDICASNACGMYGRCHMCPPDVGPIDELIAQAKEYPYGVLYQNVYTIEDSFDIEGMIEAKAAHSAFTRRIDAMRAGDSLHLGAGGCGVCERCAKRDGLPCRFPEQALPSMEAYGVDVYHTAENAGMKYINGANTITYFSLLLFRSAEN